MFISGPDNRPLEMLIITNKNRYVLHKSYKNHKL